MLRILRNLCGYIRARAATHSDRALKKFLSPVHPTRWKQRVATEAAASCWSHGDRYSLIASFDAADVLEENRQQREFEQAKVFLPGNGRWDKKTAEFQVINTVSEHTNGQGKAKRFKFVDNFFLL